MFAIITTIIIIITNIISIRFSPAEALHLRVPDVCVSQIKNLNIVETKSRCKGGVRKAFSNPDISMDAYSVMDEMRIWHDDDGKNGNDGRKTMVRMAR